MGEPVSAIPEGRLFLDVPELARIFRHDQRTIRRGCESGEIPAVRVGSRWRIPVEWVREAAGLGGDCAKAG